MHSLSARLIALTVALFVGTTLAAGASELPSQPVAIVVEMERAPAIFAYLQAGAGRTRAAAARAEIARIDHEQKLLLDQPLFKRTSLLFRTQRVHNGIGLLLDPTLVPLLADLPGVSRVYPLPNYRPTRAIAVPLVGAPSFWNSESNSLGAGRGISIGIVDTGVDYLHADLGGPGRGYLENDTKRIDDSPGGLTFPSSKVVGGYDFAGERYSGIDGDVALPEPDPDPMDCWGHGTHVAGIAAGVGLLPSRTAYSGPYTSNLDLSTFLLSPGMAPGASLYALKIFGCSGSSNLLNPAIEWAVDPDGDGDFSDHLDVLNLSIGSDYGHIDDPGAVASNNAAQLGMIIVAAAGNAGDAHYVISAPGVAERVISVAASDQDRIAPFSSRGPGIPYSHLKPDLSAPGRSVLSTALGTGYGVVALSGTSMSTPVVAGAAALLRQRFPQWSVEEIKTRLINTALPNLVAGDGEPFIAEITRAGAGLLDLDLARRSTGFLYSIDNPGAVSVSFGSRPVDGRLSQIRNVRLENRTSQTSTYYLTYSPHVDLPGVDITLPAGNHYVLTPEGGHTISLSLEAQADRMGRRPRPATDAPGSFPAQQLDAESGFVTAWAVPTRLETTLSLQNADGISAGSAALEFDPQTRELDLSLALQQSGGRLLKSIHIHRGRRAVDDPVLATLALEELPTLPPFSWTGTVVLSPAETEWLVGKELYIDMHDEDPVPYAIGSIQPTTPPLRLPVVAAPYPVARMSAQPDSLQITEAGTLTRTLKLVGRGLQPAGERWQSRIPTETVSLVTGLLLQSSSQNEESSPGRLDQADLKYVGVGIDSEEEGGPKRLLFGLVSHGEWSSPNQVTLSILIDVDGIDGPDYRLFNSNIGTFNGGQTDDRFFAVLENLKSGERELTYPLSILSPDALSIPLFGTNSMVLGVDIAMLGGLENRGSFTYQVETKAIDTLVPDEIVDSIDVRRFQIRRLPIRFERGLGGFPLFYDLPDTRLNLTLDVPALASNSATHILLLHHHNRFDERAQVIRVEYLRHIYLPRVGGK